MYSARSYVLDCDTASTKKHSSSGKTLRCALYEKVWGRNINMLYSNLPLFRLRQSACSKDSYFTIYESYAFSTDIVFFESKHEKNWGAS